jgi:hypothetical protein
MEPKGSLQWSQEPSTGPYPESNQSSPYHTILSKIHFNIIYTYVFVYLVVSFLLAFPISYMHSSSPPFVPHALPISSYDLIFLIILGEE